MYGCFVVAKTNGDFLESGVWFENENEIEMHQQLIIFWL
jgi:hypothetical protein